MLIYENAFYGLKMAFEMKWSNTFIHHTDVVLESRRNKPIPICPSSGRFSMSWRRLRSMLPLLSSKSTSWGPRARLWKCDIIFPDHTFTVIPNKISRSMLNLSCSLLTALLLFTFYSVLVSTSFVPNFITDSTDHYSLVNTLSEHLAQIVNHHIVS